jgi:hypothetical protein
MSIRLEPPAPIGVEGTLQYYYQLDELPEEYEVDAETVFDAGAVTVEDAGTAYAKVEEILAGAENSDDLVLADLFEWSIADSAENILAAAEEITVADAEAVSLAAEETATVAQADELAELENFDDAYALADTAENLLAEDAAETVTAAAAVSLAEDEVATIAQAEELLELENFDKVYSLEDTAENLVAEDASAIVSGAESYLIADPEGSHISAATEADLTLLEAAENADEFTFGMEGETIELTTDTDVVGPEVENADFQTSDADDIIEAVSATLSSAKTLNADDSIDGGEGYDTLSVEMQGNFGGFSEDGGVVNVENIDLTSASSIGRTFDATGVEGAEKYTLDATEGALSLKDLATGQNGDIMLPVILCCENGAWKVSDAPAPPLCLRFQEHCLPR